MNLRVKFSLILLVSVFSAWPQFIFARGMFCPAPTLKQLNGLEPRLRYFLQNYSTEAQFRPISNCVQVAAYDLVAEIDRNMKANPLVYLEQVARVATFLDSHAEAASALLLSMQENWILNFIELVGENDLKDASLKAKLLGGGLGSLVTLAVILPHTRSKSFSSMRLFKRLFFELSRSRIILFGSPSIVGQISVANEKGLTLSQLRAKHNIPLSPFELIKGDDSESSHDQNLEAERLWRDLSAIATGAAAGLIGGKLASTHFPWARWQQAMPSVVEGWPRWLSIRKPAVLRNMLQPSNLAGIGVSVGLSYLTINKGSSFAHYQLVYNEQQRLQATRNEIKLAVSEGNPFFEHTLSLKLINRSNLLMQSLRRPFLRDLWEAKGELLKALFNKVVCADLSTAGAYEEEAFLRLQREKLQTQLSEVVKKYLYESSLRREIIRQQVSFFSSLSSKTATQMLRRLLPQVLLLEADVNSQALFHQIWDESLAEYEEVKKQILANKEEWREQRRCDVPLVPAWVMP